MQRKIKVDISPGGHSIGRGVGFYAQLLSEALAKLPEVELTSKDPDIIHYPFFDLFYPTLPFFKKTKTIVTIHDLTPLVLPDLYPKGIKGTLNLIRQRLSLSSVKAVITDSENSKQDIIQYFRFPSESVFVTPLAIDPVYKKDIADSKLKQIKEKYGLPDNFVLAVSAGPNPNKNLPALAKVTKDLNIPLVLVGKGLLQEIKVPIHPELKDLVALKKYDHIIYSGFVPTEDLTGFYRLATLYCVPSLYEGFGLPLLEAMTTGCLVVSSNASSLPEIYHPGALTFDPRSQSEMRSILQEALSLSPEEKGDQIKAGQERAEDFSWEKTAQDTLSVYKTIV